MLPPPTTSAISTPRACTLRTCSAIAAIRSRSAPYGTSPFSASPDSFSRMRPKTGSAALSWAVTARPLALLLAHLEADEAADDDVLARLRGGGGAQVLDRLPVVLVAVDVLLLEQHALLEPLAQLALGDLRADVLGLVLGLLRVDPQLGLPHLLGHVLLGHPLRACRC